MRILIAEDDYASRKFLYKFLSSYGECDITIDGIEAVDAFMLALDEGKPYDLVCLDIMMPKLDGTKALKAIRDVEKQKGIEGDNRVKVIMTTALNDTTNVYTAFESGCEAYAAKPIDTEKFAEVLKKIGLVFSSESK
ncbi:MAG TPA: response regulator [Acetivibrio sp.]|uniref:response regulator n=1 Tax=Acetivibrio sp. TaxID=1872092 RepID=UPI002B7E0AA3|nr:response regulator [Acetivibrio sp.]HOM01374.1 response regulator [Acetivibrio sp.]